MTAFTQTDTATGACSGIQPFCTGASAGSTGNARIASEGGTAGTTAATVTVASSANNTVEWGFTITDGTNNLEDLDGATGNWTFRLNIDKASTFVDWTGVGACRMNSSCVNQETICDDQTFTTNLGSTGVVSQVVNQGSAITMGATDIIACQHAFDNSDTMMERTFDILADQDIENQWAGAAPPTPVSAAATATGVSALSRDHFLTKAATATGVSALARTIAKAFSAVASGIATQEDIKLAMVAADAVASGVAALQRSLFTAKAAVGTGIETLQRIVFKNPRVTLERLPPDAILLQTNLSGAVTDIDDDPDDPDGLFLTAVSSTSNTDLRVSFGTPATPKIGSGLQEFRALVAKTDATDPSYSLELWENGSSIRVLATGAVSTFGGEVVSGTWNANEISTADGSLVECRILGTASVDATVVEGAVEWNASVLTGSTLGAVTSGIAALQRTILKVLQATASGVATADPIKLAQRALDATATGVAALQSTVGKSLVATATGTATLSKTVLKTLSAAAAGVANAVEDLLAGITNVSVDAVATGVATLQRSLFKTLSSVASGVANVVENLIAGPTEVAVNATATGIAALQRETARTLALSSTGIATVQRLIGKTLSPAGGGSSDVKFAVINATSPAGTGTQNYTSSGFGTPVGFRVFMSGVSSGDSEAHNRIGQGASDLTSTWALGISSQDAVISSDCETLSSAASSRVIYIPDFAGGQWAEADDNGTVTDGIQLNWITTPGAGYYVTVILIGGADAACKAGVFDTPSSATDVTVTTGIDQTIVEFCSAFSTLTEDRRTTVAVWLTGFAKAKTTRFAGSNGMFMPGSASNADPRGGFQSDGIGRMWTSETDWRISANTTTSFDVSSNANHLARKVFYFAMDTGDLGIYNDAADTPTSTGDWSRTGFGFKPQYICGVMNGESGVAGIDTIDLHSADADGISCQSIFASDGTSDAVHGFSCEDAASTMNENSVSSQSAVFVQYDDTNATKHTQATVSSFDADGVTFNFTTAVAARHVNFFAIEESSAGGPQAIPGLSRTLLTTRAAVASGTATLQRIVFKFLNAVATGIANVVVAAEGVTQIAVDAIATGIATLQRTVLKTLKATATGVANVVTSLIGGVTEIAIDAIALGVVAIQRLHLITLVPKTDVRFAVINTTSPAATGNQTYTSAGFGEVKGYLVYMSGVPSGEVATHGFIGRGASDLTNTYAYGASAQDNRGPPNPNTQHINSQTSGRVIFIPNNAGGKFAEARHVGANSPDASNGITLNWVTTPGAGYDVTIVLLGGPHIEMAVGSFSTNGDLTEKTVTTGIDQKIVLFDGLSEGFNAFEQTTDAFNAYHCWGFSKVETARFHSGFGGYYPALKRTLDVAGDPRGGFHDNASLSSYWFPNSFAVTSNDETSFGITQVDGGQPLSINAFYVAIDTKDAPLWEDSFDTPSSTGNEVRTGAGFQPQIILGFMLGETTSASINIWGLEDGGGGAQDADGMACISFFGSDGTNDFCFGYSNEDGLATTNVNSVASQSAALLQYDDSAVTKHVEATVSSFDDDGVTFNFTTATGDHYVSYLAVGQGREGAIGVPGFIRLFVKQISAIAVGIANVTTFFIQLSVKPFSGGGGAGRGGFGTNRTGQWARRVSAWRKRR